MARLDLSGIRRASARRGAARRRPRDRGRRVHGLRRPLGLRQVHAAADDRRARGRSAAARSRIDGKRVNDVPPRERGIAMVFQTYALYPHMTVGENIAFGLQAAPDAEGGDRRARSTRRRGILQIEQLLERKPRPALRRPAPARRHRPRDRARAPGLPVRRAALQPRRGSCASRCAIEIAQLHRELGATMIYVTHDQVEAMTLADRIVVLHAGEIEQVGTPLELYDDPANQFVAGFIGSPTMNFLDARGDEAATGCRPRPGAGACSGAVIGKARTARAADRRQAGRPGRCVPRTRPAACRAVS